MENLNNMPNIEWDYGQEKNEYFQGAREVTKFPTNFAHNQKIFCFVNFLEYFSLPLSLLEFPSGLLPRAKY